MTPPSPEMVERAMCPTHPLWLLRPDIAKDGGIKWFCPRCNRYRIPVAEEARRG